MKQPTDLPPQFGRYRILKKLGAGGMGAVYLAEDTELNRRVALKVPHFTLEDGEEAIQRFRREARVAASIEHPNLCSIYDVGQVDGVHYFTMSYVEGTTLSRLVSRDRPWPPSQAALLVGKIALAVEAVHQRGVIHRDLKPGNVLVRPDGEPILMDFGLARSFTAESRRLTSTGAVVGTPVYMAPEQIEGNSQGLGPGTDIYSLGVVLYELLTGRLPFEGPLAAVYGQILHATPAPPSALQAGLDGHLDALCLKAMAKRSQDRFATAQEFAAVLERYARQPVAPSGQPRSPLTVANDAVPQRLQCPACGKRLKVAPADLGKRLLCPSCHTRLAVPPPSAPSVETTPELAVQPSLPTLGNDRHGAGTRQAGRGGLLAACVIGATLLLGLLGGWLAFRGHGDGSEDRRRDTTSAKKDNPDRRLPDAPKEVDNEPPKDSSTGPPADPPKDSPKAPPKGIPTKAKPDGDKGLADEHLVQGILNELKVPPILFTDPQEPERFQPLPLFRAEVLAHYPVDNTPTPLRKVVERAQVLLWALAARDVPPEIAEAVRKVHDADLAWRDFNGLPVSFRAPSANGEAAFKNNLFERSKRVASIIRLFEEELEGLLKVRGQRGLASQRWRVNYDFMLARLQNQLVYLYEYASALGQMRKEFPPRDPAVHGGWRLASTERIQGVPEGRKLARDARQLLDQIIKEHKDTPWEVLAKRERFTDRGLEWKPEK
jgi:serine/threonine protein kinase